MWQEHQQMDQRLGGYCDKPCLLSGSGYSGSISGDSGYGYSSEFPSNYSSEEMQSTASIETSKAIDSCIDAGLTNSFNQLSLELVSLNQRDTNKSATINDSGIISMTSSADNVEETCQEPWQLYFTQNDDGDTLLHTSIIQGFHEATLSLISIAPHPSLLDILNDDNQTALHLAVLTNQAKIVRRLVLAGADLSIRNYQGNTALHLACMHNALDCAKALTEPVAMHEESLLSSQRQPVVPQNLEQRNYHGETCLHVAAARNHVELVRLLAQLKADVESQESLGGRTALHLALERGCLDVAAYVMRECRPWLDAPTYSGCTALEIAGYVDEELARELVELGATPRAREEPAAAYFGLPLARA